MRASIVLRTICLLALMLAIPSPATLADAGTPAAETAQADLSIAPTETATETPPPPVETEAPPPAIETATATDTATATATETETAIVTETAEEPTPSGDTATVEASVPSDAEAQSAITTASSTSETADTSDETPPAPNILACDVPAATEIAPSETAELPCVYTANDPDTPASVTAAFTSSPGDGWTLAFGDGAAGETATWAPAEPLAEGATVDLTVRVTAPDDAEAGQQATVSVTGDAAAGPAATWSLTVAVPDDTDGDFSVMSVDPAGGACTQVSPVGTDAVGIGEDAVFRCGRAGLSQSNVDNIWFDFAATGWGYWVEGMRAGQYIAYGTNDTSSVFLQNPIDLLFGSQASFEVRLRPFQGVAAGSAGALTITYTGESCRPFECSWGQQARSTVRATWVAPTATCMLASPQEAIVRLSAYAAFKCVYSDPPFQAHITTNDTRFQWAYSFGANPVANPSDWREYTGLTFPSSYSGNSIDTLYVYIRPNPSNPPAVGTGYSLDVELYQPTNSTYRVTQSLAVTYTAVACDPTVNLTSNANFYSSTWDGDSYTAASSRLMMAIAPIGSDCDILTDGWSVSMQTDGLYRNGDPASGDHIPPNTITFQGMSGPPRSDLQPAPNAALGATGPTRIADGGPLSAGTWYIFMQLQPPNDAPPGIYSGTITVTIAGGD